MSLISLVLTIALIGLVVYLITLIPMPPIFRTVIHVVVGIVLILWVLQGLGLVTGYGLPVLRLK